MVVGALDYIRKLDGHRNAQLGLDVHGSSDSWNTSAWTATASGFKISRQVFDEIIATDNVRMISSRWQHIIYGLPETRVARGTAEDCSRRPKLAEALPVLYVRNLPAVDPLRSLQGDWWLM